MKMKSLICLHYHNLLVGGQANMIYTRLNRAFDSIIHGDLFAGFWIKSSTSKIVGIFFKNLVMRFITAWFCNN